MPKIKHTSDPWRIVEDFMGTTEIESDNECDDAYPKQVSVLAREIGGRVMAPCSTTTARSKRT
ncbi:hypothetical protein CES87_15195 [Pseudomonas sp. ERMR1:02]|nr:hypothetical protein CES87_15195 [Pseudomonas sp. ERMR1:02]